jgi:uncharacterized Zn finger protein (UPF0148 family)
MRGLQLRINLGAVISTKLPENIMRMPTQDATKKIGENLLKGWTLLGDVCPAGCNVPLMRSRDKQQLICCACDRDFNKELPSSESGTTKETAQEIADRFDCPGRSLESACIPMLRNAVDEKLEWAAENIRASNSIDEMQTLISLTVQLLTLKRELSEF